MTTPFDMTVLNDLDGFHFGLDVVNRVPRLRATGAHLGQRMRNRLTTPLPYIREHGDGQPEMKHWFWRGSRGRSLKITRLTPAYAAALHPGSRPERGGRPACCRLPDLQVTTMAIVRPPPPWTSTLSLVMWWGMWQWISQVPFSRAVQITS